MLISRILAQGLSDLGGTVTLPLPEPNTLEVVRLRLRSATLLHKDALVAGVTRREFLARLFELQSTAEDLEEMDALHTIFDVRVCFSPRLFFHIWSFTDSFELSLVCG